MKKRKRISRRLVPNSSIPETIPKEEEYEEEIESEEEEEEQVPLYGRTQLSKVVDLERRMSVMDTPPSTQAEPLELSSLEYEV